MSHLTVAGNNILIKVGKQLAFNYFPIDQLLITSE